MVSEDRVVGVAGAEFKLSSDGAEEEAGPPRDAAIREGAGSTAVATPT